MATFTIQVDDDFVHKLAEAIVRQQLGGGPVAPAAPAEPDWPSAPAPDDPWSAPSQPSAPPAQAYSQPAPTQQHSQPAAPQPQHQAPAVVTVDTPKGPRTYVFGLPGAPGCECGQASVQVQGETNGRRWKQWACAKSHTDWRNKCQFSQFTK